MSALIEVLDTIRRAGGRVWIDAGAVRLLVPAGTISPQQKLVLTANRAVLLDLFSSNDTSASGAESAEQGDLTWFENLRADDEQPRVEKAIAAAFPLPPSASGLAPAPTSSPLIPIQLKVPTRWAATPRGFYTIPAGASGWLIIDLKREVQDDRLRWIIADTLKRKARFGRPAYAVWLGGTARVIDQGLIHVGAEVSPRGLVSDPKLADDAEAEADAVPAASNGSFTGFSQSTRGESSLAAGDNSQRSGEHPVLHSFASGCTSNTWRDGVAGERLCTTCYPAEA
jgi:hypothetical protein